MNQLSPLVALEQTIDLLFANIGLRISLAILHFINY